MHEKISIHPVCFPGVSLSELAKIWRSLGAYRVDLTSMQLRSEGLPAARAALETGRYKVESVNHVFLPPGQSFERNEDGWRLARGNLDKVVDDAKSLGAKSIYMLTGGRGSLTWEDAAERFADAVAPSAAKAKEAGLSLMIECATPLYADIHLAHSLRDTVNLAE